MLVPMMLWYSEGCRHWAFGDRVDAGRQARGCLNGNGSELKGAVPSHPGATSTKPSYQRCPRRRLYAKQFCTVPSMSTQLQLRDHQPYLLLFYLDFILQDFTYSLLFFSVADISQHPARNELVCGVKFTCQHGLEKGKSKRSGCAK